VHAFSIDARQREVFAVRFDEKRMAKIVTHGKHRFSRSDSAKGISYIFHNASEIYV
jgi:hypothetical protein